MAKYFRFEIPQGLTYSPGWCGTMPKVPSDVVVDCYNDKEGYGIAHTNDLTLPKEVKGIEQKEAEATLASLKEEEGVYVGEKVMERVAWLPEAEIKDDPVNDTTSELTGQPVVAQKAQFCSVCHKFICYLPSNIAAARIILTCPDGHKVSGQEGVLDGR
jgi:hypothetical protein